jgi:hypothetical protein
MLAIDQDTYRVDGSLDIDEANGELALVIPDGAYETVSHSRYLDVILTY